MVDTIFGRPLGAFVVAAATERRRRRRRRTTSGEGRRAREDRRMRTRRRRRMRRRLSRGGRAAVATARPVSWPFSLATTDQRPTTTACCTGFSGGRMRDVGTWDLQSGEGRTVPWTECHKNGLYLPSNPIGTPWNRMVVHFLSLSVHGCSSVL